MLDALSQRAPDEMHLVPKAAEAEDAEGTHDHDSLKDEEHICLILGDPHLDVPGKATHQVKNLRRSD